MKLVRTVGLACAVMLPVVANAGWTSRTHVDDISNEKRHIASSGSVAMSGYKRAELSVLCDEDTQDLNLLVNGTSIYFVSPDSFTIRVDDNDPIVTEMVSESVDKSALFVTLLSADFAGYHDIDDSMDEWMRDYYVERNQELAETYNKVVDIITQMRAGSRAIIRTHQYGDIYTFKISLAGFTKHSKRALSACGFDKYVQ